MNADGPWLEPTASMPPSESGPGQTVGRYTLLEKLGEGGMGEVWVARQSEPVKRKVALKLIKRGLDSRAVLHRFEQERQALAVMDHPNIAKVLDGGLSESGRPFFVMELVDGATLTKYCDDARLPIRDRLALFVPVCQAVQHAHQKGVVHRDLKPANVLVAVVDGKPVPKVIDFGVAKAVTGKLTDETLSTQMGAVVGTLEYMAPEQAGLTSADVDTRADVYALGVILYELLTGLRPFDSKRLRAAALDEMIRIIRQEDPPSLSSRLSTDASLPSVAAVRGTEPKRLVSLVRGELDWIVRRCLEKDRNRRYDTANGLARDVQRFLADEPVEARPAGSGYRLKKFLRRNKGPVLAASALLLTLLVGVAGTTWGLLEARRLAAAEKDARTDADAARERETERAEGERVAKERAESAGAAERRAKEEAVKRLAQIQRGNEILLGIFADLDLHQVRDGAEPLEAVLTKRLVKAAEQLDGDAVGDPLLVADLQHRLGQSLLSLGQSPAAIPLFVKARETRATHLGVNHPGTLACMSCLAIGYRAAGKLDLALPLYEETLRHSKSQLGIDHPSTLLSMNSLALGYKAAGKIDLALALQKETLALQKARMGADHPDTLASMGNLAEIYRVGGRLDLALPLYEKTLKLMKARLGPDHPFTLACMANMALGRQAAGTLDRAIPIWEEALKLQRARLGADHSSTITTMNDLAAGYRDAGRLDRALPLYQEAAAGVEKRNFQHQHAHLIVRNLIGILEHLRQFADAEVWRRKWLSVVKKRSGTDAPDFADELAGLGLNLLRQRKCVDAEGVLNECLSVRQRRQPDLWTTFDTQSMLGAALLGQKKPADAELLLLTGYEGLKQREKTISANCKFRLIDALDRLIEFYTATNKPEEVKKWKAERAKHPTPPAGKATGEKAVGGPAIKASEKPAAKK